MWRSCTNANRDVGPRTAIGKRRAMSATAPDAADEAAAVAAPDWLGDRSRLAMRLADGVACAKNGQRLAEVDQHLAKIAAQPFVPGMFGRAPALRKATRQ